MKTNQTKFINNQKQNKHNFSYCLHPPDGTFQLQLLYIYLTNLKTETKNKQISAVANNRQ